MIQDFKDYVLTNVDLLRVDSIEYSIQMIRGAFRISNNTVISNQASLVDVVFLSELGVENSVFESMNLAGSVINVFNSEVIVTNSSANNVSEPASTAHAIFSASATSTISISQFNYSESSSPLVNILQSVISIDSMNMENLVSSYYLLRIDQG